MTILSASTCKGQHSVNLAAGPLTQREASTVPLDDFAQQTTPSVRTVKRAVKFNNLDPVPPINSRPASDHRTRPRATNTT
eukprot:m.205177 g.205177  ORF g.205177 m.205177 type:complete len:80 (-) comp22013_c0_seq3:53-292(-)